MTGGSTSETVGQDIDDTTLRIQQCALTVTTVINGETHMGQGQITSINNFQLLHGLRQINLTENVKFDQCF